MKNSETLNESTKSKVLEDYPNGFYWIYNEHLKDYEIGEWKDGYWYSLKCTGVKPVHMTTNDITDVHQVEKPRRKLESGYYKIKLNAEFNIWAVGEYNKKYDYWYLVGSDNTVKTSDLEEIGERIDL